MNDKSSPSTSSLLRFLAKTPSMDQALERLEDEADLIKYLYQLLSYADLDIPGLAERICASKAFVYQIFGGIRKPGREILLRIAFAIGLPLDETQKLLALGRRGSLYPRMRRDFVIIYALQHGFTLEQADEALRSVQEEPLLPIKE